MTAMIDRPLPLAASHEPGIYSGIPLTEYHSDPTTLSSSGARKLLRPSCPAKFRWEQDHPERPKQHFELGTLAHTELLGDGPEIVVLDYPDWRTKAAQAEKAEAQAAGAVPVLAEQFAEVQAMVRAVRSHPQAGPLLAPGSGVAEQSLYWVHSETGVTLRARPDWLRPDRIVDYKTCAAADPESIQRDVQKYGYHVQEAWYRMGIRALGLAERPKFTFVFQEKTAPYLVTVCEIDAKALEIGQRMAETAIHRFAECTASGVWPDYMADAAPYLPQIALPAWAEREYL